jgi:hypothetical protein
MEQAIPHAAVTLQYRILKLAVEFGTDVVITPKVTGQQQKQARAILTTLREAVNELDLATLEYDFTESEHAGLNDLRERAEHLHSVLERI